MPLAACATGREPIRAWMSWSTGKDSAYALHLALRDGRVDVGGLFTTVEPDTGRVAYNGVPVSLAQAQAEALGLPLHLLPVPTGCPAHAREVLRRDVLTREAVPEGVRLLIFGDADGTDIRAARAARLEGLGIGAAFPLWGMDTRLLARMILAVGVRAIITRVDPRVLGARWAGKPFDEEFITSAGGEADPCGERGEFHTFTCWSPDFGYAIAPAVERLAGRGGSVYAELAAPGSPASGRRQEA
jgi:diphthamide synthase (EF-2-diphthine--ammonia ligase)